MKTLLKSNPMKKLHAFILMFALVIGNISTAAVAKAETAGLAKGVNTRGSARNGQYKVDFVNKNGTKLMNTVTVNDGESVAKPAEMKCKVKSWKIQGGGQDYNFSSQVTKDLTLVAEYDGENPVPGTANTTGQEAPSPNVKIAGVPITKYTPSAVKNNTIGKAGGNGVPEGFEIPYHMYGVDEYTGQEIKWDYYHKPERGNLRIYEIKSDGTRIELKRAKLTNGAGNKFFIVGNSEIKLYGGYQAGSETEFLFEATGYKTVRMKIRQGQGYFGSAKIIEYKKGADALGSYDVNFEDESGTSLTTQKVVENDKVKDPILDEISYWYVKGDSQKKVYDFTQKVTENLTLVGVKEQKVVNVSFTFQDKENKNLPQDVVKLTPDDEKIPYGTKNYKPKEPAQTEVKVNGDTWKFIGWKPDKIDEVKNDLHITGIWECKHEDVKITFTAESDTAEKNLSQEVLTSMQLPESKKVESGTEYTIEELKNKLIYDYANKGSWKFTGWTKKDDSKKITKLTVTEDTTLVAHWEFHNDPKITFRFVANNTDTEGKSYPDKIKNQTLNLGEPKYGFDFTIRKPNILKVSQKGGYWEFKGWSLENSDRIIEKLEKVDKDTSLVGHYKFEKKDKVKVNFEYKSKLLGKALPDNIKAPASQDVEYYDNFKPTRPDPDKVIVEGGNWIFEGWDPTSKKIDKESTFTGYWRFEAENPRNISFKFVSDTPQGKTLPDNVNQLKPKDTTVTYGKAYEIPKLNQTEVVVKGGIWKFKYWTETVWVQGANGGHSQQTNIVTEFDKVTYNKELTGHWEFVKQNAVNVNLKFADIDGKQQLPKEVTDLLTTSSVAVAYGDTFNPNDHTPTTKSVTVKGGIWSFKNWTPTAKQITDEETFVGKWQFEEKAPVKISFEFKSISNGKNLPDKVTNSKPADTEAPFGTTYKAPEIENQEIVTDDGEVWEFAGWEEAQLELTQDKVTFTGKWKFTGLKYTVQYYNEGSAAPLASAEFKTDENCNVNLNDIDTTKELNDNYKFSKIVYRDNEQNPDATLTIDKDNRIIKVYYKKNTTKLTIKKEWHNIDTSKQRIPKEVKVDVLRRVNGNAQAEYVCRDVIITKDNNWTSATLDVDIQPKDLNNKDYTYIITEQPLPGFVPLYVKHNQDGAVAKKDNEGNLSAEVINVSDNSSYIDLNVVKTDDKGLKLSGAVFRMVKVIVDYNAGVVTEDDSYVREITTGGNGTVTFRLMNGIYKLTEEKAPKGYMIDAEDYYVEVDDKGNGFAPRLINDDLDDDKKIETDQEATDNSSASYKLSIVNKKIKDNSIYKTDQDGKAVAGAKFDLYKKMSDDNTYPIFVEVDNSQIGGEQFNVTAQLYEIGANEEQVGADKALSDTEQHNVFDDLSKDKQYKVKFTFDGRFQATVSYDKDTNTVTLHLMPKANSGDIVVNNADNNSNDNAIDNTGADNNAVSPSTTSVISENETSADNIVVPDNSTDVNAENAVEVTADVTENLPEVTAEVDENNGINVQEINKPDNGSDKQADIQILGNPAASLATVESEIITLQAAENHQGFVKIRTDITSGNDGEINLGVLEEGEYYLKETQAPTKAGGKYEMTDDVFYFNITPEGDITLPEGSAIKEKQNGAPYSIVNNWIADPLPEDNGDNQVPSDDNSTSDPFIPPYTPTEPASNDDIINDDDTPLSNTDTVDDIEEDDVVIDENDAIIDNDDEDEEDTVEEDDVPLATLPKTGEKQGYGFIVYLATLICGITLLLAKIAESLKKRR